MSQKNNAQFINILKNSGPDFQYRDELIQLHSRALQLESSINLRKQIEYEYNKLKLEEVKERIDEIQFQKKFFNKRNNDILNDIQKLRLKNLENASNSKDIFLNIQKQKKRYRDYLDSLIPKIQTEFNVQLHKESNKLAIDKIKELKELKKIQDKNNYYDEITKVNEKLANEIENLKRKNLEALEKNKEKEKLYLESQKLLQNQINYLKLNEEKEKNKFDINEYFKPNQNKDIMNQISYGKFPELNNMILGKDSINSDVPLQDLKQQNINPGKGIPVGTLHQNFGNINVNVNNDFDKNNKNNLGINDKIINEGSNFNLLNSKKEIDNVNNNKNDMIMNNNSNIKEVNFININSLSKKNSLEINKPKGEEIKEIKESQSSNHEYDDFEKIEV